jgi:hypothetical protein
MARLCRDCGSVGFMIDPWDDSLIRIFCKYIGTATMIPRPEGWEEGDQLPDLVCAIKLGSCDKKGGKQDVL